MGHIKTSISSHLLSLSPLQSEYKIDYKCRLKLTIINYTKFFVFSTIKKVMLSTLYPIYNIFHLLIQEVIYDLEINTFS